MPKIMVVTADGNIFPGVEDYKSVEAVGNEGINENTNDFSPLSSGSSTNTDDKSNPDDEADQSIDQQAEQQTIGNEVNQITQQQTIIIK